MNQLMSGVKMKLITMTAGMRTMACADKLGIVRTMIVPTPKSTEPTIPPNSKVMDCRVVIRELRLLVGN